MRKNPRSRIGRLTSKAGAALETQPSFEQLEPRVVLSTLAPNTEMVSWGAGEVQAVKGAWVITFNERLGRAGAESAARDVAAALGVHAESVSAIGRGQWAKLVTKDRFSTDRAIGAMSTMRWVVGIEPDAVRSTAAVPNDPRFGDQWHHENVGQNVPGSGLGTVGADISSVEAWDRTIGSQQAIVAVIDSGVDYTHPDLAANIWTNPFENPTNGIDDDGNGYVDDFRGWDFGQSDNDPQDDVVGHGTSVAGVIGAVGNNGLGIAGVAWNVSILPAKIADDFGNLVVSAIVAAHDYLTELLQRGVNIVASNGSYGGVGQTIYANQPQGAPAERAAIQRYVDEGGIFVAAAGNDAFDNDNPTVTFFPATYNIPGVISVAATDNNDALASFSNYGAQSVDLGAPGDNVLTTIVGGGYDYASGTSFAAPAVAGAVALLRTVRPTASAIEVRAALFNSTDPLPSLQGRTVSGGRLNLAEALRIVGLDGPVVTQISPGPVSVAPVTSIVVRFSEALDPNLVALNHIEVLASGGDGIFGNGNDVVQTVSAFTLTDGDTVLTLTPNPALGIDTYRLTLNPTGFRDLQGNFLNGDSGSGTAEQYIFRAAGVGANFEPNDTIPTATPVTFGANSTAFFSGMTIGDGLFGALDVDLYRINMPRGGLITARVDAKTLATPSNLDSYLRLFNASGQEIASNDQFNGDDSFLDFFVTTGGNYYVGVSGFPNSAYNPQAGATGTSQSRGVYNLTLTTELVNDDQRTFTAPLAGPRDIPEIGVLTDVINVPDNRMVLDVNLSLRLNHDFVGDLRVSLIAPNGREVVMMNRRGGSGDFQADPLNPLNALYDDESAGNIVTANPPYGGGTFRPEQPLSDFDAESALGNWTLRIEDTTALNAGQLLGWSLQFVLQNDIFGPFELNDTMTTAKVLTEIDGTGTATRAAAIGDGGFGVLDVDLFRFTADAGSTLTATAASGGSLNTALRLFDSTGRELKFSNPDGTNSSSITNFVFADGGEYLIGVSESTNGNGAGVYDPASAASGLAANTTGGYTLTVSVASGVSDGSVVLTGENFSLGVSGTGSLGALGTGLRFNDVEFLITESTGTFRTRPFYGAVASGFNFSNDGPGGNVDLPMSVTVQNDAVNRRVVTEGFVRGMRVERSISFDQSQNFVVFDVTLTNVTSGVLTNVGWMEALNPDPGMNLFPTSASTANDVRTGAPLVTARYQNNTFPEGLTVAFGAPTSDTRAMATVVDETTVVRDPRQILDLGVVDPNGALADDTIAMAFDIGLLNAGQSTSMRYFLFMGLAPTHVDALYDEMNAGTGTGHLTADPTTPADDADGLATLPYTLYYPEGFANARSSTFIPIVNPNNAGARVVVIARYETGVRDQVIYDSATDDLDNDGQADGVIAGNTRSGLTLTNPTLYTQGDANEVAGTVHLPSGQLKPGIRKLAPYALEIRSSLPLGAMSSHFDFGVSTGEAFTSQTSQSWAFAQVSKGQGSQDFIVFYNPSDESVKVTTTLIRETGGTPITLVQTVGAKRRSGWNLSRETAVAAGKYGVLITAEQPIVAAVSSFTLNQGGFGALAMAGGGTTSGATPEGQFGLNADAESITILNPGNATATVTLVFTFDNASAYRALATVGAQRTTTISLADLSGFPTGRAYGVQFTSTQPVALAMPSSSFGEQMGSSFAGEGHTLWALAEGYRPAGNSSQVTEYLRIYNPSNDDSIVEIKVRYDDGQSEISRVVAGGRRITEVNVHSLITGVRTESNAFYSLTVKSATPIVVYQGRSDSFFGGANGTLGTPLGLIGSLV